MIIGSKSWIFLNYYLSYKNNQSQSIQMELNREISLRRPRRRPTSTSAFLFEGYYMAVNQDLGPQSVTMEYKNYQYPWERIHKNKLTECICAFLNTQGGTILIGIKETKEMKRLVKGNQYSQQQIEQLKKDVTKIAENIHPMVVANNLIRSKFIPVVSPSPDRQRISSRYVVKISVNQGWLQDLRKLYNINGDYFFRRQNQVKIYNQKADLEDIQNWRVSYYMGKQSIEQFKRKRQEQQLSLLKQRNLQAIKQIEKQEQELALSKQRNSQNMKQMGKKGHQLALQKQKNLQTMQQMKKQEQQLALCKQRQLAVKKQMEKQGKELALYKQKHLRTMQQMEKQGQELALSKQRQLSTKKQMKKQGHQLALCKQKHLQTMQQMDKQGQLSKKQIEKQRRELALSKQRNSQIIKKMEKQGQELALSKQRNLQTIKQTEKRGQELDSQKKKSLQTINQIKKINKKWQELALQNEKQFYRKSCIKDQSIQTNISQFSETKNTKKQIKPLKNYLLTNRVSNKQYNNPVYTLVKFSKLLPMIFGLLNIRYGRINLYQK